MEHSRDRPRDGVRACCPSGLGRFRTLCGHAFIVGSAVPYKWLIKRWVQQDSNLRFADRRSRSRIMPRRTVAVSQIAVRVVPTSANATFTPPIALFRWLSRARPRTDQPRSDFRSLPWLLNSILKSVAALELNASRHVSLPFGTSLFAVARKNG